MNSKFLTRYFKHTSEISHKEIAASAFGALLGISLVALISRLFVGDISVPIIVASMGASAVILFAVPSSPMAQPWSVLGGHIISALIGVTAYKFIPGIVVSSAIAVAAAIAAMHYLQCLHPPGGATALIAILGGAEIHQLGYLYVLAPILLCTLIILVLAFVINHYILKRPYPSFIGVLAAQETRHEVPPPASGEQLSEHDIKLALQDLDTFIDVSMDDLNKIYELALKHAHYRKIAPIPCNTIMTKDVFTAEFGTELEELWQELNSRHIKTVPVVDRAQHVIGIISIDDFISHANSYAGESFTDKIKQFVHRTPGFTAQKPEVAGQIMNTPPITVKDQQQVSEVLPLFVKHELHHIPVVDEKEKLVGILTRTDIMATIESKLNQ